MQRLEKTKIGTKTQYLVNMSKSTSELFKEYCERVHSSNRINPANWIELSPRIAEQLKEIKKQKWKKKK